MRPTLFADRFLVTAAGRAVDLASGEDVLIRTVSLSGRQELDAWSDRCAGLYGLWHPHLVGLLDFGSAGRASHFEAFACAPPHVCWKARDASTADALVDVTAFLATERLAAGNLQWPSIVNARGIPALLPDAHTGMPLEYEGRESSGSGPIGAERQAQRLARVIESCGGADRGSARRPGLRHEAAGLVMGAMFAGLLTRVTEVFDTGVSGRPRVLHVQTPEGPARVLLRRALARTARLRGYIPVSAVMAGARQEGRLATDLCRRLLAGRHVLVIHEHSPEENSKSSALFFLELGLSSERPHVLLMLHQEAGATAQIRTHDASRSSRRQLLREETAGYVVEHHAGTRPTPYAVVAGVDPWPDDAPGSASRGRQGLRTAAEAAARGRHAEAARLLSRARGYLVRRGDDAGAGEAALALGRLLLPRGQVVEAARAFEAARQQFDRARLSREAVRAGVFIGLAWTDSGRLTEAEGALRAARISAHEIDDDPGEDFAAIALARCLLWQSRLSEAHEWLEGSDDAGNADSAAGSVRESAAVAVLPLDAGARSLGFHLGDPDPGVARSCLLARVALGTGDLAAAGRAAVEARERAARCGTAVDEAAACCVLAAVYAAVGDISILRQHVQDGLDAARRGHAPLRALRLRLVLAEGLLGSNRAPEARLVLTRLARLDPARLPVVVRRPLERLLRGGPQGPTSRSAGRRSDIADAIVDILADVQAIEDEEAALRKVSASLRQRTRSASLAYIGREHDQQVLLAGDGQEPVPEQVARRAIESGLAISPASSISGKEAAVPIRVGGAVIGAVACRWAADVTPDWPRAGALLAAAGAATSPAVRAVLDRRACPAPPADPTGAEIVGVSDAVGALKREIARAATAPFSVVIEGESGSGKELVARAIHRLGPRRHRRLCALNCAALSDELVEAEMFGHARGAFTGAIAERKGLFEEADGGTLIFDEVGELTARAQAKLLRAIQEGEVRRIGENFARSVDVRIVAATNRSLRSAVEAGSFRQDLLYRLEVIRILVPPLRARPEDIPVLAAHFWHDVTSRLGSRTTLAPATLAALAGYDWPGNVRELQNVMAALAVAVGRRGSVGPERLPGIIAGQGATREASTLDEARRSFEARFVRAALARAGGRRSQAARDLGLSRQGLMKLMIRLRIDD
ncbi:MAG TPA: sigma 54-interacting transcriptional regulator [Vicinamibacterales bacterium]|jgi:transcriptional regulator with PAS, ATPase and Fis domain